MGWERKRASRALTMTQANALKKRQNNFRPVHKRTDFERRSLKQKRLIYDLLIYKNIKEF
jgi:hypothetical protein